MKCYYTFDEVSNEKVLIPGCMSVVNSNDIEDCCCTDTFASFEKKRYNELLKEKNNEIQSLQTELKKLVGLLTSNK